MYHKHISYIIIGFFISVLLATPLSTYAYYTTAQNAIRLTDNIALYTIDFTFGFPDRDVYIPIATKRDIENNPQNPYMGYTFYTSADGDPTVGTAAGLVLSSADIENNMYKVPAGERGYFTLVVFLTLDPEADPKAKYGLQVSNLPFITQEGNTIQRFGLNKHELQAYKTKKVGLLPQKRL